MAAMNENGNINLSNEELQSLKEVAAMRAELRNLANAVGKLPCVKHSIDIAVLQVKSGLWGILGGVLVSVAAWLMGKQ